MMQSDDPGITFVITWAAYLSFPYSKVHGANMGPIWGRQDPGGPHVGPMNFAIWVTADLHTMHHSYAQAYSYTTPHILHTDRRAVTAHIHSPTSLSLLKNE